MSFKRSISSSSSLEIIGYNEDIMTEISLYLPVNSILRFRSVSKQWNCVLSHRRFIKRYANKSTNSFLFFELFSGIGSLRLNGDNRNLDMVDFGYMRNSCQDNLSLKRSCNGLLLFESNNFNVRDHTPKRRRFYVCNPSTRKYIELAVHYFIATNQSSLFLNLAFDPSKSPHYKVIFFWNDHYSSLDYHIAIYSSDTRSCRKLSDTYNIHNLWLSTGEVMNGAIHWLCSPFMMTTMPSSFYFDIDQESIKAFPKPPSSSPYDYIIYFGECRGHLHLIFGQGESRDGPQRVFDVYELNEDYSSWLAKYKVYLDAIEVDFREIMINESSNSVKHNARLHFLHVLEEDEKDPSLVLSVGSQLLAYNFIDKTTKKLCNISCVGKPEAAANQHIIRYHQTFHCIESLSGV